MVDDEGVSQDMHRQLTTAIRDLLEFSWQHRGDLIAAGLRLPLAGPGVRVAVPAVSMVARAFAAVEAPTPAAVARSRAVMPFGCAASVAATVSAAVGAAGVAVVVMAEYLR